MRVLFIFDQKADSKRLREKVKLLEPTHISLFPLTSQERLVHDAEDMCRSIGDTEVKLEESAKLIDKEVDILRERISKWSADFGNYRIAGKSIKEWFSLPESGVSTWWFSLLSEKSPFKTDVFFRLTQLQAIDKIICSDSFDICIFSISIPSFSLAIKNLCKRYSLRFLCAQYFVSKKKLLKERIKSHFSQEKTFFSILKALAGLIRYLSMVIRTRLVMGSIKKRIGEFENPILFVSYFPSVDKELAKKGILKNKFAVSLQDKLTQMQKRTIWIWLYVFLDENSYNDALRFAKKFKKNGEVNFLLYEFLSLKSLYRVLFLWVRQIQIFLRLKKLIPEQILYENLSVPEGAFFIKNLMAKSFIGRVGLEGILYFELFKGMFSNFSHISRCIYYAEMQAWEKALCAAKELKAPGMETIGFFHSSLPINLFPHFHHHSEMRCLPLPNILACNGDIPLKLMGDCGYPNLIKVESTRYLYLNKYLDKLNFPKKENIILLIGSSDESETKGLISLLYEAFPVSKEFKIWLKGHPCLPFESILEELDINLRRCGYIIKYNPLEELLKAVRVLIVGNSTVALEALIADCKVIIPVFNDSMFTSPLKGFEEYYEKVYAVDELKNMVDKIMRCPHNKTFTGPKNFVEQYWCLDESLQRWQNVLA